MEVLLVIDAAAGNTTTKCIYTRYTRRQKHINFIGCIRHVNRYLAEKFRSRIIRSAGSKTFSFRRRRRRHWNLLDSQQNNGNGIAAR